MPYEEVMKLRVGKLPVGMEGLPAMKREVYLYNPDQLPGLKDLQAAVANGDASIDPFLNLLHSIELLIDNELYVIAPFQNPDAYELVD